MAINWAPKSTGTTTKFLLPLLASLPSERHPSLAEIVYVSGPRFEWPEVAAHVGRPLSKAKTVGEFKGAPTR